MLCMKPKFSPSGATTLLLLLIVFYSCKENQHKENGIRNGYNFDTARAAKSVIPIKEAVLLQQSFINTRRELEKLIKDTSFLSKNFNIPNGEAFTKDALLLLLSQKEADGVRLYYGKDSKGVVRLVLLPIRKDGTVIYTKLLSTGRSNSDSAGSASRAAPIDEADAVETGQTCPPCLIQP